MTSKHFKPRKPSDADLKSDPGIGQSKGLNRATGNEEIAGENTDEGDVANDTLPSGGIDPDQRGRANK
ncbi:hypothetical protein [Rhizobium sp. LC145]|jgi:hypothetical protein|uniref:hypothetical protein n=1 Tax=Rhizobium sp. LC145 TaxID=1120688 RepID=UPI00062A3652|nr:hypothetical protein [Rhizobium sp. LC145]KKX30698.1 ABC-type sugar transport system, ATPase component [Rhizobium sp. LC145]TKT59469.1 hypothetical protein FDR95_10085 [Rhizobiaceae bacterium LC148]